MSKDVPISEISSQGISLIYGGESLVFCLLTANMYLICNCSRVLGYDVYAVKDASRPVSEANVPIIEADLKSVGKLQVYTIIF